VRLLPDVRDDRPLSGTVVIASTATHSAAVGLVACGDVAIAAPDAVFGFSEVQLGIVPAVISPFVLPKIGAHARATSSPANASSRDRAADRADEEIAADLDAAVDRVSPSS